MDGQVWNGSKCCWIMMHIELTYVHFIELAYVHFIELTCPFHRTHTCPFHRTHICPFHTMIVIHFHKSVNKCKIVVSSLFLQKYARSAAVGYADAARASRPSVWTGLSDGYVVQARELFYHGSPLFPHFSTLLYSHQWYTCFVSFLYYQAIVNNRGNQLVWRQSCTACWTTFGNEWLH